MKPFANRTGLGGQLLNRRELQGLTENPTGMLKITATPSFAYAHLMPAWLISRNSLMTPAYAAVKTGLGITCYLLA